VPSLVAGWLLSLTISLDDVIMSAFLSGPETTTLPLVLLSRIRLGMNPEINAVGALIIMVVSVGVIANSYFVMKKEQRQAHNLNMALRGELAGAGAASPPDT
jgi:putrescine transport system permease protein